MRELLSLPDGAVRPTWDAGPTGGDPFVVVSANSDTPIGSARRTYDGKREVEILRRSLLTDVQFEAFGTNAYALLSKLQLAFESSEALSALKNRVGAAILRFRPVIDVSAAIGGGPEERAQFTATLTHTHSVELPLVPIERVDVFARTDLAVEQVTIEPPHTEQ